MRICIDARMINPGSMHGIARYVYHLLHNLKNIGGKHTFFVLINQNSPLKKDLWPDFIKLYEIKSSWISIREHFEIPSVLKKLKCDLFHAPSYVAPLYTPCNMVMTIHDVNHIVLPQFYTPFHQIYYRFVVKSCIKRSKSVLTVSQFSKDEIVNNLDLGRAKVFVTYNGVSERYKKVTDSEYLEYVRDIYELPERFIFCLSNNKPHKNIQQLVRAYCFSGIDIPLVLACPVDKSIIRIAENFGKKHRIYFTKFISEQHLPAVYSLTDLFVFPSTYEGFGLPPLEALSCGTPVVVARSSSLPEVVGNNAIFVNPYDYKAIAAALERGIYDDELRGRLKKMGAEHAKGFSWLAMSQKTLEIYERSKTETSSVVASGEKVLV